MLARHLRRRPNNKSPLFYLSCLIGIFYDSISSGEYDSISGRALMLIRINRA